MIELPRSRESAPASASALAEEQARQNRTTRSQWQMYASHRQALERLIVPERRGNEAICVLGAGNCNDLDLKWLVESYRQVHLVDLDPDALASAVERQGVAGHAAIHRHAPVDLTGIADEVSRWSKSTPSQAEIDAARLRALEPVDPPWGRFDVVLSPCVLTQTMNPARDALRDKYPPSHPSRVGLRDALRLRHLRMLAPSVAPGGRAVLAIDLISAERFTDLPRVPQDQLDDFMRSFIAAGRHYRGLEPSGIAEAYRSDPSVQRQMGPPAFTPPWLWHLGLRKTFLVYAAIFRAGQD